MYISTACGCYIFCFHTGRHFIYLLLSRQRVTKENEVFRIQRCRDQSFLVHLYRTKDYGGFFFFKCRDYPNLPQFYSEFLQWWRSEFREMFASEKDWVHVIWNNKDVRIDKKPIFFFFYKNYDYDLGIIYICDLQLNKSVKDLFHLILEKISKTNFLVWAGLRHSIPHSLRSSAYNAAIGPLQLILEDNIFQLMYQRKNLRTITKHQ